MFGAFTMDTIASTGFGVEVNSLKGDSDFTKHGKTLLNSTGKFLFIAFFCNFLRPLLKLMGIEMFDKEANNFFSKFIDQAIESRKQGSVSNSGRSDFIQLMLDAEKDSDGTGSSTNSHKTLSYNDIRVSWTYIRCFQSPRKQFFFFLLSFT